MLASLIVFLLATGEPWDGEVFNRDAVGRSVLINDGSLGAATSLTKGLGDLVREEGSRVPSGVMANVASFPPFTFFSLSSY